MQTLTGALAGSRRDVCAVGRGASDSKMSVARGSLEGRAQELSVASGASLFAARAGADRSWNLEQTSDMILLAELIEEGIGNLSQTCRRKPEIHQYGMSTQGVGGGVRAA